MLSQRCPALLWCDLWEQTLRERDKAQRLFRRAALGNASPARRRRWWQRWQQAERLLDLLRT